MTDYPKLIELFARYKVSEIPSVADYVAYCAENIDKPGFRVARDRTQRGKKAIEERLDGRIAADQPPLALRLLGAQRSLDFDCYYDVIVAGYKPAWSRSQQVDFEQTAQTIRAGKCPELINFFARYKVSEIQNIPEYTAYCNKNKDRLGWQVALHETEMAKKAIEGRLDGQISATEQIRRALMLLEARRSLDFDCCYELMVAGYQPAWSPNQQVYFEHAARIIRGGKDFFLSFTSRGPESKSDKILTYKAINRRYLYYIRPTLPLATDVDRIKRNLLADAIDTALRDELIEGFYYKRHESDNSVVMRKLREACESCLVFVQLVDKIMFAPPKDPNYCEFEYRHALQFIRQAGDSEQRVLFVVAAREPEDLPDPELVHAPYKDWVEDIKSKSAVYLPPVPDYDKPSIDEIKRKVAGVVSQVKAAKRDLLERIPN